jgi:CRP-like cAMP-binding protein
MALGKLENEPVKLSPHSFSIDREGRWIIKKEDGSRVEIPPRFQVFFQAVIAGASLSKMILSLKDIRSRRRFIAIREFLGFLNEEDLLIDGLMKRFVEATTPGLSWPKSFLLEPLIAEVIFTLPARPNRYWLARTLAALFVAIGFIGLFFAMFFAFSNVADVSHTIGAWGCLAAMIITATAGRICAFLCEVLMIGLSGCRVSVLASIEAFSISFRPIEKSVIADRSIRAARLFSALFITTPFAFIIGANHFGFFSPVFLPVFSNWALLVFISEMTPFAESRWTSGLRNEFAGSDERESRNLLLIYKVSTFVWPVFAAFIWSNAFIHLRAVVQANWGGTVLGCVFMFFVLSWVDDFLGAIGIWNAGSKGMKKYWIRRPKSKAFSGDDTFTRAQIEALPLLRRIPIETRGRMIENARIISVDEGKAVCRQGDNDRSLYILISGQMAVAKRTQRNVRRKIIALLESGSVFGEAAFFFASPRTADVVAMERSRVLMIPHDSSMKTIDLEKSEELQTRIWFLQVLASGSFLRQVPSDALDALITSGRIVRFKAGAKVISEGEAGTSCFFIVQGKASVTQNLVKINALKNGDAFGEIALLFPGALRTATVLAESDLLLVAIDAEKFWSLLADHFPLAIEIEILAEARLARDEARGAAQGR